MKELVIHTDAGNLDLTPATPDELNHIAAEWPMGVILNEAEAEPNGLVFQIGKEEAYGVKLQPPDTDEPTAQALYFNNLALVAAALPFYLEHGHRGILLPCTYYKKKSDGRFESGIAFFMSPRLGSTTPAPTKAQVPFDDELGEGASNMIRHFAAAVSEARKRLNFPLIPIIGVDVRPRSALGALGMSFLVQGARVFAIEHPLGDDHPAWAFAVRAGYSKLPYAPMIPTAVPGPPNAPHAWLDRVRLVSQRLSG
jgi:hypothetical protein